MQRPSASDALARAARNSCCRYGAVSGYGHLPFALGVFEMNGDYKRWFDIYLELVVLSARQRPKADVKKAEDI